MRAARYPGAVLVVVAAVMLGGCGAVDELADRVGLGGPSDAEMLAAVSLTTQDVAPSAALYSLEGGDEVAGRTSLDLCFGSFPSEDLRVGRHQVGVGDDEQTAWVSSEAVLYGTPAQAEQAMSELEAARDSCPDEPVDAPAADQPPLAWTFDDPPDADWPAVPGVTRQAYAFAVLDATGGTRSGTATYLQRGRMVLALYSTPPDGPQRTLLNSPDPARFTAVMAERLASLPESALRRPGRSSAEPQPDGLSA